MRAPAGGPTVRRDRVTAAGYAVLGAWGWFLYGFGALLPRLGEEQGISRTVTGLHSVVLSLGALVAGAAGVPLVRALRRRGALLLGCGLLAAGAALLAAGSAHTAATLAAVAVVGLGGSLLVNTAMPVLADHHAGQGAAVITEGNAVATAAGLVAPLAVGAGLAAGAGWQPATLVTLPLVAGTAVLLLRCAPSAPGLAAAPAPRAEGRVPLPAAVGPAVVLVMLCVGVEFCTTAWTADLLRQRAGLSPGAASAGVAAVIAGMTAGRLVTGRLALRHEADRLLVGAVATALAGWAITWLATDPVVAVAGLVVTGLGIAAHYPLGASLVLAAAPGQQDRAAGRLSVGVGVAAGAGPFALGALADASDTRTAFVVVPVLLVLALGALAAARRARLSAAA